MGTQLDDATIARIDRYLDQVPRSAARTEEIGPFTLFVGEPDGWPYYARPSLGRGEPIRPSHVRAVVARQRELDVPLAVEALTATSPCLAEACAKAGMRVHLMPLLVHRRAVPTPVPDGIRIRRLESTDPALAASHVVAQLGFAAPGANAGKDGAAERDARAAKRAAGADDFVRARVAAGQSVTIVAEDEGGVVATGAHIPVGDATEIVGVATLPAYRRQGLGAAVTSALVADALRRGVPLVLLSAGGGEVARVYERVGFERVGTALAATA